MTAPFSQTYVAIPSIALDVLTLSVHEA